MKNEVKIPTLLGLGVLLTGLTVGIFLVTQNQTLKSRASQSYTPQKVTVVNLSDTQASIYWQTDQETTGFVQAGTSNSLNLTFKDERDLENPQNHRLHFVTLKNLTPQTTYYYKINSGPLSYPPTDTLSFKTTSSFSFSSYNPLVGTVVDSQTQPINEALVTLEIPGAQKLATITKISGNFILPLASIKTSDLTSTFALPESTLKAQLTVFDPQSISLLNLTLPYTNPTLPIITLGQNLDLVPKTNSPSAEINHYDLNKDGVINSLDLGVIMKNYGKKTFDPPADLNQDGKIDQKDVTLINQAIPKKSSLK